MKSIKNLGNIPAGLSITSDELIELHASRVLLLISICGVKDRYLKLPRIEGLTKLAKLDFFIRYPEFFERAAKHLGKRVNLETKFVESKMMRFHYGPWDERYYQILPYLEARNLIEIRKFRKTYEFYLTSEGKNITDQFLEIKEFQTLVKNIKEVKGVLGRFSGTKLKNLIYELFDKEIAEKKLREII